MLLTVVVATNAVAGLFFQMLLTAGNVIGHGKGRKGGKIAKDRMTVGLFCNATGTDFWKPVFIGKAAKPRCFGQHWNPSKIGGLYFHNDKSWMRGSIWVEVLRAFNRYCYTMSNAGADPVILLADNCAAHCCPTEAKAWKDGDLQGFRMSNILVIFFAPNCTSKVQPLDAGVIQAIKALYRKRHMSWILNQLNNTPRGQKPMLRCNIRQSMEWFMAALMEVTPATVVNCWVASKILTPAQMHDLETGLRHNGRAASSEGLGNSSSVPPAVLSDLADMLSKLSTKLSADPNNPVRMADAIDILDMPMEREVFDPPAGCDDDDQEDGAFISVFLILYMINIQMYSTFNVVYGG